MDLLPNELYDNIIRFLSTKDKISMREVDSIFESKIKKMNLVVNRVENQLQRSQFYRTKNI